MGIVNSENGSGYGSRRLKTYGSYGSGSATLAGRPYPDTQRGEIMEKW